MQRATDNPLAYVLYQKIVSVVFRQQRSEIEYLKRYTATKTMLRIHAYCKQWGSANLQVQDLLKLPCTESMPKAYFNLPFIPTKQ